MRESDSLPPLHLLEELAVSLRQRKPARWPSDDPQLAHAGKTRAEIRAMRKRAVRAHTFSAKRYGKERLEADRILYPEETAHLRPKTRAECWNAPRPCPFVSCRHHLFIDADKETGAIKFNFPDLEVWELRETCSLDVAERGGATLEQAGELLNVTRERIRQIENQALEKSKTGRVHLRMYQDHVPKGDLDA